MGKAKLYDLSQPFGDKCPLWPYFDGSIIRLVAIVDEGDQ